MLKLIFFISIFSANIAFSVENTEQPNNRPNKEADVNLAKNEKSIMSGIKGNSHVYAGINLNNSASVDGTVNNSNTNFAADLNFNSPAFVIGFNLLPVQVDMFRFGAGFMYEIKRDVTSGSQRFGSGSTTSFGKLPLKLKVSTLSFIGERFVTNGFSLFGGINYNFISLDGTTQTEWQVDSSLGSEFGLAYTNSNFRAEFMYKIVSGDVTTIAKSVGGVNSTGTYDYNHLIFTVGLVF